MARPGQSGEQLGPLAHSERPESAPAASGRRSDARRLVGVVVLTLVAGFSLGFLSFPVVALVIHWPALAFPASLVVVTVFVALWKLTPPSRRYVLPVLVVPFLYLGFLGVVGFLWAASTFGDLGR